MGEAEEVAIDDTAPPAAEISEPVLGDNASEEAILDRYTKDTGEAPADEPVADKATEEAKPVAEVEEEKGEEKPPLDERLDPKQYKDVFKRHPALRAEHYTLQAYREVYPDIKEARELRQIFPSKDDAIEARGAAEKLLQLDADFRANPSSFVKELHTADPQAFYKLASQFSNEVYSLDPKAYDAYFIKPVINEFTSQFREYARGNRDDELIAALDVVEQRLGRDPNAAPVQTANDDDPRFAKLREYERQEQERAARGSEHFYNSAGDTVKGAVSKEVTDIVERAGSSLSPGAKNEIVSRVIAEVGDVLSSDSYLQKRIQFFARAGNNNDPQIRDNVVRLMMTKARTVLRDKTQEKINWMTRDILSLQEPKKAARLAQRRDPGDGGRAEVGAKPRPKNTASMSEDEILDAFMKE